MPQSQSLTVVQGNAVDLGLKDLTMYLLYGARGGVFVLLGTTNMLEYV